MSTTVSITSHIQSTGRTDGWQAIPATPDASLQRDECVYTDPLTGSVTTLLTPG